MRKEIIYSLLTAFLLVGCNSGSKHGETTPGEGNTDLSDVYVYKQESNYKSVLKKCASAEVSQDSCTLQTLPLLHQETLHPTKEQIMQRVLVSDDWMGQRFSTLLDVLDDDVKDLLGGVTAIVIDNDVRPAYYWSLTGAIYLDPRYLWLTPDEAKTISVKDDYRQGFGNKLKFLAAGRYVKDNKYAYGYYPLDKNITRSVDDIKYSFARLLYHELSHANDYAPLDMISKLDKRKTVLNALYEIRGNYTSTELYKENPLQSNTLKSLGQVLYHGETPTAKEKAFTPNDVGVLFNEDSASDMYGYSNQYEDLAMMFEQTMMKYHYNLEYDVGFVINPSESNATYKDYVVGWGVRNRISQSKVSDRALFVVKKLLPNETDWDEFFVHNIGKSQMLKEGVNWYDNLELGNNSSEKRTMNKVNDNSMKINPSDFERFE